MNSPDLKISDSHDWPFAIFQYDPKDELLIRKQIKLLKSRLKTKNIIEISLSDIFWDRLKKVDLNRLFESEREHGLERTIDTIHSVLSDDEDEEGAIEDLIEKKLTEEYPSNTIIFLVRVGVLFPVYRTSAILENLYQKIKLSTILFYPGTKIASHGLKYMGLTEPNYNYRGKIY
ncbi:MAG: BREX protein BrxB domain-containing protein [Candidatus Thorarchaeota archaeon]